MDYGSIPNFIDFDSCKTDSSSYTDSKLPLGRFQNSKCLPEKGQFNSLNNHVGYMFLKPFVGITFCCRSFILLNLILLSGEKKSSLCLLWSQNMLAFQFR